MSADVFEMKVKKVGGGVLIESDLTELDLDGDSWKVLKAMTVTAAAVVPYLQETER